MSQAPGAVSSAVATPSEPDEVAEAPAERWWGFGRATAIRVSAIVVFLVAWELYGRSVNPIFMSYPTAVASAFATLAGSGELSRQFIQSIQSFLLGYVAAAALGVTIGMFMGRYRNVEYALDSFINALYSTPTVALVPLLVLWFGLGFNAKVAIVFLSCLFPIVINTHSGVKNVSGSLVETGQAYCATERQLFTKIIIPAAMPFIMLGLRLAVARGVVGMIVAEMFTAITGLGAMIVNYSGSFATDKLFVPIIVVSLTGVVLTEGVKLLERRLIVWKETERAR